MSTTLESYMNSLDDILERLRKENISFLTYQYFIEALHANAIPGFNPDTKKVLLFVETVVNTSNAAYLKETLFQAHLNFRRALRTLDITIEPFKNIVSQLYNHYNRLHPNPETKRQIQKKELLRQLTHLSVTLMNALTIFPPQQMEKSAVEGVKSCFDSMAQLLETPALKDQGIAYAIHSWPQDIFQCLFEGEEWTSDTYRRLKPHFVGISAAITHLQERFQALDTIRKQVRSELPPHDPANIGPVAGLRQPGARA